jgi:hypothetical protein
MGAIWLRDLPAVIAAAGLHVQTWPGWENRARSSGGYDDVRAVGIHHDAWPAGRSLHDRCSYAWDRAGTRPIGALWLHTDATVVVGAAGATNTQGRGGPYPTSRGTIPLDAGNRYMISVEASNNGVGEPWPPAMQDAYVVLCRALCAAYGLNPATDVVAHFEWTTRKIDPAGPSRWAPPGATGSARWNMAAFRAEVATPPPPPPPPEDPDMPLSDDDVARIARAVWAHQLGPIDRNTRNEPITPAVQYPAGRIIRETRTVAIRDLNHTPAGRSFAAADVPDVDDGPPPRMADDDET